MFASPNCDCLSANLLRLSVTVTCMHACIYFAHVRVPVVPTVLVGNKADLEIGREVTTEEGQTLAQDLRSVSVVEKIKGRS